MNYEFTEDWFDRSIELWDQLLSMMTSRHAILEVGAFEGRATAWLVENMLEDDGHIVCIDTWRGSAEHVPMGIDFDEVESRFNRNVGRMTLRYGTGRKVYKEKGTSVEKLAKLIREKRSFDFIYIDGSHTAPDVLTDACLAWPLLRPEGILVFDDYLWGDPRDALRRPRMAVDAFTNLFGEQLDIVHIGYQVAVRRRATPVTTTGAN